MIIYNSAVEGTVVPFCGRVWVGVSTYSFSTFAKFSLYHTLEILIVVHLMFF